MFRKLTAVEIAEGALLADIALVFELLSIYVPFLHLLFRALVPIVFAVLALRHDLYVGLMALSVTFFLVGVMTGPHFLLTLVMAAALGLFMGTAMKRRMSHLTILLLGVTGYALVLWGLVFLLTLLAGLPISDIGQWLEKSYSAAIAAVDFIASHVGLGEWWRDSLYPAIDPVARLVLQYWWAVYLAVLWVVVGPIVIAAYAITNSLVRLMGYDVRPFPGKRLSRMARSAERALSWKGLRRSLAGRRQAAP